VIPRVLKSAVFSIPALGSVALAAIPGTVHNCGSSKADDEVSNVDMFLTRSEVVRVLPVALNPVNFADEWIRRTWQEAQGWSATIGLAALRRAHSRLHKAGMSGDFGGYRSCADKSLSEVEFDQAGKNGERGPEWFFRTKERPENSP